MFDWQIILVVCALLLACVYVGRRGWLRVSSLSISKRMNAPSCAVGCGGCGAAAGETRVANGPGSDSKKIVRAFRS
jgi:hypothetical protein